MTAATCPCAPCAIAAELTQHRNQTAARWGQRRIVLNFAATIAASYCTNTEETVSVIQRHQVVFVVWIHAAGWPEPGRSVAGDVSWNADVTEC